MAGKTRKKATRRPAMVREPVQVYLDATDRDLLERLGAQTGSSKAELLRRGLRSLAARELTERPPGWSFDVLIGALGAGEPTDLSVRHDEYLYDPKHAKTYRGRTRAR